MTVFASLRTFTNGADRWIVRHPVTAFLIWFFTFGQAIAFLPLVARQTYGITLRLSHS